MDTDVEMDALTLEFSRLSSTLPEDTIIFREKLLYDEEDDFDSNNANFSPTTAEQVRTITTVDEEIREKATSSRPLKRKSGDNDRNVFCHKKMVDPENAIRFANRQGICHDDRWARSSCLALPFIGSGQPNIEAEERLYEYLNYVGDVCKENMIIVHSFRHGVDRGIFREKETIVDEEPVVEKRGESKSSADVDETDIIIIHRTYGPLIFEVKSLGKANGENVKGKIHCPLIKINEGNDQLKKRWNQIDAYVAELFSDEEVRNHWSRVFEFASVADVVNAIRTDTRNRSFLCLFYYPSSHVAIESVSCCLKNCTVDSSKHCATVEHAKWILSDSELSNRDSFLKWWCTHVHGFPVSQFSSQIYLLMLNRIVMDHCRCPWYREQTSLTNAIAYIDKVNKVVDESLASASGKLVRHAFEGPVKVGRSLHLSYKQLRSVFVDKAELCIQGPAGTGKTVILVQKVNKLLDSIARGQTPLVGSGCQVLVLCFNLPLLQDLRSLLHNKSQYLRVVNIDKALIERYGYTRQQKPNEEYPPSYLNLVDCNTGPGFNHSAVPHIFIDEAQDLPDYLLEFLYQQIYAYSKENENSGHFWLFYDPAQNLQTDGIETFLKRRSMDRKYLNNIYRACQQQFQLMKPFIREYCTPCKQVLGSPGEKSSVASCKVCAPKCGAAYQGPVPTHIHTGYRNLLYLAMKQDRTTAQLVSQALHLAWKKNVKELLSVNEDDWHNVLVVLRKHNCLTRTAVLSKTNYVVNAIIDAFKYKQQIFACRADDLESIVDGCLRVETFHRFKGLEADVVIVYDPPLAEDKKKSLSAVVFTRAKCLTILICSKDQWEVFSEMSHLC